VLISVPIPATTLVEAAMPWVVDDANIGLAPLKVVLVQLAIAPAIVVVPTTVAAACAGLTVKAPRVVVVAVGLIVG
jgi:hypothetical protein